jgi:hypothetical protein
MERLGPVLLQATKLRFNWILRLTARPELQARPNAERNGLR